MSRKEVEYSFAIGGALSSSFKAAITGAKNEFAGLAKRIQELEETDTNKIGSRFVQQKEHLKNLGAEYLQAKQRLERLQNQSKEAGKHTKIFELQVQEAEKEVSRLSQALDRNVTSYQKNIAQIKNTQGSVQSLAAKYAKLSLEMEKTKSIQNKFKALQERQEKLKTARSTIQAEMLQTAVPALALSLPIKQAVEFEAAMADVAKTMDGMRDDDGKLTAKYYAMEQAVKNMARQIPLSHAEIAGLFAAAGQQGLTELSDIQEFVTMSAQMAVAFGISQEQAADAIGGYRASLGLSFAETRSMLDLMNQFANTSSATEQDIAEVVRRVGALGQQAGVTAKTMASMTANLVSMKIQPEIAATGIKNLLLALTAGEAATKSQAKAFNKLGFDTKQLAKAMQKGASAAIQKVLGAIRKLPQHEQLSILNELFGTQSIASVSSFNLDKLSENLAIMADETQYAGAMQKEFEARCNTTAGQLQTLKNKTNKVAINLGSALLPAINDTIGAVSPLITGFAEFAKENPEVIKYTVSTAGALLGVKMAGLACMYAVNGLRSVYTAAQLAKLGFMVATRRTTLSLAAEKANLLLNANAARTAATATKSATVAQNGLNFAMKNNPMGKVVTIIGLVVSGMYALYQNSETVRNAVNFVFESIAGYYQWLWEKLQSLCGAAKSVAEWLGLIDEDAEITLTENKTIETSAIPAGNAANAVAKPMPVFPASEASEKYISQLETANQSFSNVQNTQISIPMNFEVQGLDEREFRRQMENARPDFEEIIKRVMEKVSHEKARISFAN